MVGGMSPFRRTLLRYGAATASFACGLALLAVEGPAGLAWTLIVLSLGLAVQRASAIPPCDRPHRHHTDAVEQRHLAESRRTLLGPR
jgi:hypothetical protein